MKEKWIDVSKEADKELKEALLKEGVPKEELEEELKRLKKNAEVSSRVRAILITPETDGVLKRVFEVAVMGGVCNVSYNELEQLKEALWH